MRSQRKISTDLSFRSFWSGWGSKEPAKVKPKTPSIFSRVVPSFDGTGKRSPGVPKGNVSITEALNPARVTAAIEAQAGDAPSAEQQRLIDAGLELLEHAKRLDEYTIPQIEALDAVATLVFSETLSTTLPVFEQFQIIIDSVFLLCDKGKESTLARPLASVLTTFLPPDTVAVFEDLELVQTLRTEEDRLAVCSCMRLSLGEEFEAVGDRIKGAISATAMYTPGRGRGNTDAFKASAEEEPGYLLLSSLSEELQSAVLAIDPSDGGREQRELMQRLFNILLQQHAGLREHAGFEHFARYSAVRLRLQCQYVQLLARLFSAFDPESTGKISFELLKGSVLRISSPEQAKTLLGAAHPDEDGMIAYPVLLRMLREVKG